MAKFSIEYKRVVRLAPYETLTIGIMEEFDTNSHTRQDGFDWCKLCINEWIDEERARLAPGE